MNVFNTGIRKLSPLVLMVLLAVTIPVQGLDILAFSNDGRQVAFISYQDISLIGDAAAAGWIYIQNTLSKKTVEKIQIAEFIADVVYRADDPEVKEKVQKNKTRYEGAIANLKKRGFVFDIEKQPLPAGIKLDYVDKQQKGTKDSANAPGPMAGPEGVPAVWDLTFYLQDPETQFRMDLVGTTAQQWQSKTTDIGATYAAPDGRTFVFFYHTPYLMEFDPGYEGSIIINRIQLSDFFNGVGFAYYKKKNFAQALENFKESYALNEQNPKACYNLACMSALEGKVEEAIEYLKSRKSMGTDDARDLFKQVHKDSDFNKIRENSRFKSYLSQAE